MTQFNPMDGFKKFVCEGDSISIKTVDGFTCTATVFRDDCMDRPDERQDGFWPSMNPNDVGYIGAHKTLRQLRNQQRKAESIMRAWEAGDWWYCGISVTVSKAGVELVKPYHFALWGVECNYPGTDNSYLCDIANELLSEALRDACAKVLELVTPA